MNQTENKPKNYTGIVLTLTVLINGLIAVLFFMPKLDQFSHANIHILPMLNAIFNSFTFIFLLAALIMIKQKNIKGSQTLYFGRIHNNITIFDLLCDVPLDCGKHALWRRRYYAPDLFLYFNYTYLPFCNHCAACAVYADQRLQHAGRAPQKNCEMDNASMAVCKPYRRYCIFDDFTVLLKAILSMAFFTCKHGKSPNSFLGFCQ